MDEVCSGVFGVRSKIPEQFYEQELDLRAYVDMVFCQIYECTVYETKLLRACRDVQTEVQGIEKNSFMELAVI